MTETENVKNLATREEADPVFALMEWLNDKLADIPYEVISLERELKPRACIRAFIDFKNKDGKVIGVEDCANASERIGALLETEDALKILPFLSGHYDLEVSSPGINRPLKRANDYERFSGSRVKLHLLRPATAEELSDPKYFEKNPRQRNYLGILRGLRQGKHVVLEVDGAQVNIPYEIISKANLEPEFSFSELEKSRKGDGA